MGLLEKYIFKEYLKILMLTTGILVITYLSIDFFEKVRVFAQHDPPLKTIALFFLLKLPRMFFEMIPLALLFATVLTMGHFSRTNEITAIRAGGISLIKVMSPLLGLGVLLGILLMIANLSFIPTSNRQSGLIKQVKIEKKNPVAYFKQEKVWLRLDSRNFFNIQVIEPNRDVMHGVSLYQLSADFVMQKILEAKEMRFQNGQWVMFDGVERSFLPGRLLRTTPFEEMSVTLNRVPQDFQGVIPEEDELTFTELNHYRKRLEEGGSSANAYSVEMAMRTALPFTGLVMILLGIPLGLQGRAQAGLSKGIGLCLVVALAYWFVLSLSLSLGKAGILHPIFAAWLANLTFLGFGFWLYIQIRQ